MIPTIFSALNLFFGEMYDLMRFLADSKPECDFTSSRTGLFEFLFIYIYNMLPVSDHLVSFELQSEKKLKKVTEAIKAGEVTRDEVSRLLAKTLASHQKSLNPLLLVIIDFQIRSGVKGLSLNVQCAGYQEPCRQIGANSQA